MELRDTEKDPISIFGHLVGDKIYYLGLNQKTEWSQDQDSKDLADGLMLVIDYYLTAMIRGKIPGQPPKGVSIEDLVEFKDLFDSTDYGDKRGFEAVIYKMGVLIDAAMKYQ